MEKINGVPIAELCGHRPELVREAFDLFGDLFPRFEIKGSTGEPPPERAMLFDVGRKVIGKDVDNIAQARGDCVSWGMRNAVCYAQFLPIYNGTPWEWKDTFAPYYYGISRVQIGGGRMWGDGSCGVWAAAGVLKYGCLATDADGCPEYSGSVAGSWGKSGPPAKFIPVGQEHLIKTAAPAKSLEDVDAGLENGYPSTVASDQGFQMEAGKSGFHEASGSWSHQMAVIGTHRGNAKVPRHYIVRNSWGDVHGRLADFEFPDVQIPVGCLRVRPEVLAKMIAQNDSFVISPFVEGFPAQLLPRDLFNILG